MSAVRSFTLVLVAVLFLVPTAYPQSPPVGAPQAATAPAPEAKLEDLPDQVAAIDKEMTRRLNEYLAVIDKEAKAKRLSAAYAESLRWSGKAAVEDSFGNSSRALLTTARTPIDNHTVSEARDILDATVGELTAKRKALRNGVELDLRHQVAAAVKGNPSVAELKALGDRIDATRVLLQGRTSESSSWDFFFTGASNAVRWLQTLGEAEASQDPQKLRDALPVRVSVGDFIPETDRKARSDRAIHTLVVAVESAQKTLNTILETGQPRAERETAFAELDRVVQQLSGIGHGFYLPDIEAAKASVEAYRELVKAATAMEAGDKRAASIALGETRMMSHSGAPWTVWVNAQTAKWLADLGDMSQNNIEQRRAKIRAQLAGVKSSADLDAVVESLGNESSGENDPDDVRGLKQNLAALSSAWSSASPMLLQQERYGSLPNAAFAKEVGALRKTVERDVLVRALRVPELNQAPLADVPVAAALEKFTGDLSQRGEWKRLCQVLEAQAQSFPGSLAARGDLLSAVRAFLAGQNFELAEQWREAIQAYKEVLRSTSDAAPTNAAAERLKALTKAHPETNAPGAVPPGGQQAAPWPN